MILVTGGAGYIGSHTCVELLSAGFDLVVIDNLCNSCTESLKRVCEIVDVKCLISSCGVLPQPLERKSARLVFIEGDIRDKDLMRSVFECLEIEAVIHFAGLKAVGESVMAPLRYYDNNVTGSLALFEVMAEFGCKTLVFSSSATVYGDPAIVPIKEDFPLSSTNPYGASKLAVENILRDLAASDPDWSIGLLRYFNPVGAHESGLIGEGPNDMPNNLMPFVSQVAIGQREFLSVFGDDYDTPDGTGIRDYIHVVDLSKGHVRALGFLHDNRGVLTVNLGTGRGYSVLEMVHAFQKASKKQVGYQIVGRRPGDVAQCYADPATAFEKLGWKAELDIVRMCEDTWRWQMFNPNGYEVND